MGILSTLRAEAEEAALQKEEREATRVRNRTAFLKLQGLEREEKKAQQRAPATRVADIFHAGGRGAGLTPQKKVQETLSSLFPLKAGGVPGDIGQVEQRIAQAPEFREIQAKREFEQVQRSPAEIQSITSAISSVTPKAPKFGSRTLGEAFPNMSSENRRIRFGPNAGSDTTIDEAKFLRDTVPKSIVAITPQELQARKQQGLQVPLGVEFRVMEGPVALITQEDLYQLALDGKAPPPNYKVVPRVKGLASQEEQLAQVQTQIGNVEVMQGLLEGFRGGFPGAAQLVIAKVTLGGLTKEQQRVFVYNELRPAISAGLYRNITGDKRLSDLDAQTRALPLIPAPWENRAAQALKWKVIKNLLARRERLIRKGLLGTTREDSIPVMENIQDVRLMLKDGKISEAVAREIIKTEFAKDLP